MTTAIQLVERLEETSLPDRMILTVFLIHLSQNVGCAHLANGDPVLTVRDVEQWLKEVAVEVGK